MPVSCASFAWFLTLEDGELLHTQKDVFKEPLDLLHSFVLKNSFPGEHIQ